MTDIAFHSKFAIQIHEVKIKCIVNSYTLLL